MKILTFCIAIVAALAAAASLMGCNTKSDKLSQVTVTPASQIMMKNTKQQFSADGTFSNGMIIPWTQVVVWSTSDTTIAEVDNTAGLNGIVTSFDKVGTVILTAFDVANKITGTALLTVADPESIQIVPTNSFMPVGAAHQFTAIALFSNGTDTQAITLFATWSSLSSAVATIANTPPGVAGNGIVTVGTITGTTVITATDPNSSATGATTITVTSAPITALTVSPVSMSTSTQQFSAIGTFQDLSTTPSLTTTWAWSSSNTAVATIDYYTGIATAVGSGAVTITATDPITGVSGNTVFTIQ